MNFLAAIEIETEMETETAAAAVTTAAMPPTAVGLAAAC